MGIMKCFPLSGKQSQIHKEARKITSLLPLCGDKRIFQFPYLIFFFIRKYCKSFKFFPFHGSKMDW